MSSLSDALEHGLGVITPNHPKTRSRGQSQPVPEGGFTSRKNDSLKDLAFTTFFKIIFKYFSSFTPELKMIFLQHCTRSSHFAHRKIADNLKHF